MTILESTRRPAKPRRVVAHWAKVVRSSPSAYEREVFRDTCVGPDDAARILLPRLGSEITEVFCVLGLDGRNHVMMMAEVARGGAHGVSLSLCDIFRVAVAYGASEIVLAHNHPSGDPTPSRNDIAMTHRAMAAGEVLSIGVADHVIIAGNRHVSMRAAGFMGAT